MSNVAKHPKIGNCKVLIESEVNFENGTKFFALIQSKARPKWAERYSNYGYQILEGFHVPIRYGTKSLDHHYVLWGNSPDFTKMGITHLVTPSGRPVRGSKPISTFFEMIRSSEFMTFIHKEENVNN